MKSFTIAAILASTAAALPASLPVPSCLPSGVIPSGIPLPSSIPTCLPTALPKPGDVSGADNKVTNTATGKVHSVVTVTNKASKNILVELEPAFAKKLTGLDLGSVTEPIGQITQIAPSVSQLTTSGLGAGYLTVATQEGQVALVKLTSTVEGLLSTLGLPEVGTLVGGLVGSVESLASGDLKRNPVSDLSITNLNGDSLLVHIEPTLTGLLSELNLADLASLEGPIGSVIAQVPASSDLVSKATSIGADPSQLLAVLSQNGASVLLVQVESTVSGLLSTLGLSTVGSTVGSVVPVGSL